MQLVYVAGAYRAKTKIGEIINILKARKVAKELWKVGYAAICPHSNTALYKGLPDSVWLDGDIEMLTRCDLMVLVPGWENSQGTLNEIDVAKVKGIPIYIMERGTNKLNLIHW